MKRLIGILVLLGAAGLAGYLMAAWPEWTEETVQARDSGTETYHLALESDPPSLDPALVTDSTSMQCVLQMFDGLVRFESTRENSIAPSLASTWTISPDQKRYTFVLRPDALFHARRFEKDGAGGAGAGRWVPTENGGRRVRAADVKFSFERILDPGTHSPRTAVFEVVRGAAEFISARSKHVDGIRIVDDRTVEIELAQPYAPFMATLTMPTAFVLPREDVEKLGSRFARSPVGSGAFILESYDAGSRISMVAHTAHFQGAARIKRLVFHIIPDEELRFNRFLAGELHHSLLPDPHYPIIRDSVRSDPNSKWKTLFTEITELGVYYYGMNVKVRPFDDVLVRRAFCHAIDKEAIRKYLKNERVDTASSPLPRALRRWIPTASTDIALGYDPERAGALLAEAGYPLDPHIGLRPDLSPIPIHVPKSDEHVRIAQAVQANLADIGIRSYLVENPWKKHLALLKEGKAGFFRLGWIADYKDPDNFLFFNFHSKNIGQGNYSQYASDRVDQLLIEARENTDPEFRRQRYREVETLVLKDAVWTCLFYYKTAVVRQPNVRGINLTELGEHMIRFQEVWLEPTGPPR